jgi:hypothetical protein
LLIYTARRVGEIRNGESFYANNQPNGIVGSGGAEWRACQSLDRLPEAG